MNDKASKPCVAIVGYGNVGRVLARAFVEAGYPLVGIVSRTTPDDPWLKNNRLTVVTRITGLPVGTGMLILCIHDDGLKGLVEEVINWSSCVKGMVVAHTAGALSAQVLEPVRKRGALPLAWHPLQTFTGDEDPSVLKGVTFGIDGDDEAIKIGEMAARDLGGKPFIVPPDQRPLYHLSGVFASNLVSALVGTSIDLMKNIGMDENRAYEAIRPLLTATISNIFRKKLPDAITGPVRRKDLDTIGTHLEILENYPEALEMYRVLSRDLIRRLHSQGDFEQLIKLLRDES